MKNSITTLNEFEGSALLKKGGIPVIDGVLVRDYPEAAKAANLFGFPVALKICSEDVPHKTERGGVLLNIADASSLDKAVRELNNRFSDVPHAKLRVPCYPTRSAPCSRLDAWWNTRDTAEISVNKKSKRSGI